jgi:RNA polymerase sigma-70 factor (ECF subfamily)
MPRPSADIAALYDRHREGLLLFFVRRTTDTETALDLWAETFAQALANRHTYRGSTPEQAAAWLYSIARKQLALYYRRGRAEQRALQRLGIERPEADELVDQEIMRRAGLTQLRRELAAAVATLSDDTRLAVEMRVIAEMPYPDVARRLQISEEAARARVSRGLRALGQILDAEPMPT